MENVNVSEWIRCPVCGNKTRDKMRENTVLENFPLFCPKCKRETLISVKTISYINYHRASRKAAEPMIPTAKAVDHRLFLICKQHTKHKTVAYDSDLAV